MYCQKCGTQNDDNNFKCVKCGEVLHSVEKIKVVIEDDGFGRMIPKNNYALISYYLGLFSFFPFIGLILGIAAVILGIKGLQLAKKQPESKGKIHSWVGIICGGFFTGLYLFLLIMMIFINKR